MWGRFEDLVFRHRFAMKVRSRLIASTSACFPRTIAFESPDACAAKAFSTLNRLTMMPSRVSDAISSSTAATVAAMSLPYTSHRTLAAFADLCVAGQFKVICSWTPESDSLGGQRES